MHRSIIVRRDERQFWSAVTASAIWQCFFVVCALRLCPHARPTKETPPTTNVAVYVVPASKLTYEPLVRSYLTSNELDGGWRATGFFRNLHPRIPRARMLRAEGVPVVANLPASLSTHFLQLKMTEPAAPPITDHLIPHLIEGPDRVTLVRTVEVGGFPSAVGFDDFAVGQLSDSYVGLGDGIGNGGGRVVLPVRIISKPTPTYTEDARANKIEGEVIVDVEFYANGTLRVLGVVRSLGHGLDEAAVRAVEGIKFSPASLNGEPVDFQGRAHVEFHLAP